MRERRGVLEGCKKVWLTSGEKKRDPVHRQAIKIKGKNAFKMNVRREGEEENRTGGKSSPKTPSKKKKELEG